MTYKGRKNENGRKGVKGEGRVTTNLTVVFLYKLELDRHAQKPNTSIMFT